VSIGEGEAPSQAVHVKGHRIVGGDAVGRVTAVQLI